MVSQGKVGGTDVVGGVAYVGTPTPPVVVVTDPVDPEAAWMTSLAVLSSARPD